MNRTYTPLVRTNRQARRHRLMSFAELLTPFESANQPMSQARMDEAQTSGLASVWAAVGDYLWHGVNAVAKDIQNVNHGR